MNKYLLLITATALATASTAEARTPAYTFTFASVGGQPFCDGGTVYTNGNFIWSWIHYKAGCGGAETNGSGRVGKQGVFKGADMSDNFYAVNYGSSSVAINYLLPKKIKNGAPYEVDIEFSGTTAFTLGSGTLIVGHDSKITTKKSTTSILKQVIAQPPRLRPKRQSYSGPLRRAYLFRERPEHLTKFDIARLARRFNAEKGPAGFPTAL